MPVGDCIATFLNPDLHGFQAPHGDVIPPNVLVIVLRPDILVVNGNGHIAFFIELTCPCQKNSEYDQVYKQEKYSLLVADLSQKHQMFQFSVYVSARGSISEETQARFKAITLKSCDDSKVESQKVMNMCSKAATCFSIFSTRNEPYWLSSRHGESICRLYYY